MVERIHQVRRVNGAGTTEIERTVEDTEVDRYHRQVTAAQIVWYIAGIVLVLLAFRFVFALLGANPANPIAHFVYTVSYPLVAPFFGLFGYNFHYGIARFEIYTLVAMAVYAVLAYGVARLFTLTTPPTR